MNTANVTSNIKPIAQAGLISKGVVYCLLGTLVFMAAFHIAGQSTKNTNSRGVFDAIHESTGGKIMLGVMILGLLCYSLWRAIQCFRDTEDKGSEAKGLAVRARYLFSGLIYASLAVYGLKMLFTDKKSSGNSNENMVQELLNKPFGQWLVGIAAAVMIAVGIYQIYYSLSEKLRKHIDKAGNTSNTKTLLLAGKIGYIARGIVWLIIGWLFIKAALHSNSSEAGDTSKAFKWLSEASYGSYLLAAIALGLICYGVFNFIRARYENF
jgi:hypothetical protein